MTKRLYLLNGNSNHALTTHLCALAKAQTMGQLVIEADTVLAAPLTITSRADCTIAAAAILAQVQARFQRKDLPRPDGMLLACFGEPGLAALREQLDVPVVGLLESSALTAMQLGRSFSILTAGQSWPAQLAKQLRVSGIADRCCGIGVLSPESCTSDPKIWRPALQVDLKKLLDHAPSEVVILGGGYWAGRAASLNPPENLRILDSFLASLAQITALMRL